MSKRKSLSPQVFISHASKDAPLVRLFVNHILLLGLELSHDDIFCTSIKGMDIKNGADFRHAIRNALNSCKVVLLIVTPNYKASEICMNEMGAAWASDKHVVPLIVEPITYSSVGVIMEPLQIPKIGDASSLSKLKDELETVLGLPGTSTAFWETARAGFLADLSAKVAVLDFPKVISPAEADRMLAENARLTAQASDAARRLVEWQSKYDALSNEKGPDATRFVNAKFEDRGEMEKFEGLASAVAKALNAFSTVTKAIVVSDYFDVPYDPPDSYKSDLDTAVRRKQISMDDEGISVEHSNGGVAQVHDALNRLKRFIGKSTPAFSDAYEAQYSSPLEIDNEAFWEEHFDLHVPT